MITCEFEDGGQARLRHATVDGIIVRDDGAILLTMRSPHLIHGGKWALPGGYMERDEIITQALAREVKEETGWEIGDSVLLAIQSNVQFSGDDRQNVRFIFLAPATKCTGEPDHESTEQRWFHPSELPPILDVAFDHYKLIQFYLQHLEAPQTLPRLS